MLLKIRNNSKLSFEGVTDFEMFSIAEIVKQMQEGLSPEQFSEIFDATKKIIEVLGSRQMGVTNLEQDIDPQVVEFLKKCRLSQYSRKFSRLASFSIA